MQVLSDASGLATKSFRKRKELASKSSRARSKSFKLPEGLACKSFRRRKDLPASLLGYEAGLLDSQKDLHASPFRSERTCQQVL